jgi:hypothetical protein
MVPDGADDATLGGLRTVYAFAIGLIATYVILGILVVITMLLSHAAFAHMPGWCVILVYLSIGGLCAFMLAIGNVLAIMGAVTVGLSITLLIFMRMLPLVVPLVADALLRPFRRRLQR